MNRVPDSELVLIPGGTLITGTPEEGRKLALTIARHTIHNLQPDLNVLKGGQITQQIQTVLLPRVRWWRLSFKRLPRPITIGANDW